MTTEREGGKKHKTHTAQIWIVVEVRRWIEWKRKYFWLESVPFCGDNIDITRVKFRRNMNWIWNMLTVNGFAGNGTCRFHSASIFTYVFMNMLTFHWKLRIHFFSATITFVSSENTSGIFSLATFTSQLMLRLPYAATHVSLFSYNGAFFCVSLSMFNRMMSFRIYSYNREKNDWQKLIGFVFVFHDILSWIFEQREVVPFQKCSFCIFIAPLDLEMTSMFVWDPNAYLTTWFQL